MATVKLFGALRDRAKADHISIPEGMTIIQILKFLGERYGPAVRDLLLEEKEGELRKRLPVVILMDGISQTDLERVVRGGEAISIFPAVAGG